MSRIIDLLPEDIGIVASDSSCQDWNRLEYKEIHRKAFIEGAEYVLGIKSLNKSVDENTELKAMVNEFIKLQKENYGCGMDTHLALIDLVIKTPTQCLADYRNSVIDECINAISHHSGHSITELTLNKLKKGGE